jgi:glutamine amidotransferase-like uncharacterized protein
MQTIGIFVHHPQCELDCAHAMASAFKPHYNVRMFTIEEFDNIVDFDIVAFPGGIGDADDFDFIFTDADIATLKTYLANGGKYLGICMGAYWAGKNYFDILGDIDAVQYIEQPNTDILTEYETWTFVQWRGLKTKMYFYDGCAFVGDLSNADIIGEYGNGDTMALIKNGVGVIGCHPEAENWWFDSIGKQYYINHHNALMRFAKNL